MIRGISIAGTAVGIVALAIMGYNITQQNSRTIPTVVYQLGGSAAETYNIAETITDRCATVEGGDVTLVNAHGSIELRNSAAVNFEKISKNRVRYRVAFSPAKGQSTNGRVAFFVNSRKKNQPFTVATPDYSVAVTGTYFHIDQDLGGKTATRVLEGSVKITDGPFADTVLHSGQYLQFDPVTQRYRIFNGGEVVQRSELETFPEVDALLQYKAISIRSTPPGADVFIDGRYCGTAPLTLRQPAGWHTMHVELEGHNTIDTSISLTDTKTDYALILSPERPQREKTVRSSAVSPVESGDHANIPAQQESKDIIDMYDHHAAPAKRSQTIIVSSAQIYNEARKAERNEDWHKALRLYQRVLSDHTVSPLRREDALFSVAKILAEHGNNVEVAKEAFLTYLALFPAGTFAGESWLRLAELEFRKNPERSIQYYLKFFEMFPRHPRIAELQDRVGIIYMQQKRYEKAITMFEQALNDLTAADGSRRTDIAAHLYRALLSNGEEHRAESIRIEHRLSVK